MPTRPPKACQYPGCAAYAMAGSARCQAHAALAKQSQIDYDANRGTVAQRGYGSRWQKFRKGYKAKHPWCATPGCERMTEEVHHIKPLSQGGSHFDLNNLKPLCKSCHSRITKGKGK